MNDIAAPTILIVPGLRDHVPEHWQTLLEQKLANARSVPRMEPGKDKLSCAAWVAELDKALAAIAGPVILVAHSAGAIIVAHWAQKHSRLIKGALLATPPDFESPLPEGYRHSRSARERMVADAARRTAVPDHRRCEHQRSAGPIQRIEALAEAWGSKLVNLGNVGHLNPASGHGEWPQAEEFIRELAH